MCDDSTTAACEMTGQETAVALPNGAQRTLSFDAIEQFMNEYNIQRKSNEL